MFRSCLPVSSTRPDRSGRFGTMLPISIRLFSSKPIGEATVEWNEKAVVAAIEELGEFLIGRDPFATDYLISTMHRNSYWRMR